MFMYVRLYKCGTCGGYDAAAEYFKGNERGTVTILVETDNVYERYMLIKAESQKALREFEWHMYNRGYNLFALNG